MIMKLLKVLYILLISSFSPTLAHTEIKAVIFDFDGTLIHTGIGYFLEWQYAFQRHGYELNSDEFWDFMNQNNLVGSPKADEMTIRYFSELLGRDCSQEIYRDKQMFSHKFHESSEFPPIEATVNFLHALGKAKEELGLKIGLASANTKKLARSLI
jgi:beta-phosphoglucomutase-like phosphatase (HAD superfamily)